MAAHLTTRTDQPYVYEDLNLERPAFRLVRLFSGDGPKLKCELLQAFLDERESIIPYEAVSYTWGHINLSCSIDIDGKSLGITASLHVALQHFRYTDRDRILWVDGICINQSNQKERGHQVQQMAYIYRQAERVIFWLGWATNDTDEFMEAFQRLTKQSMQHATASWAVRDARWHCMWVASQPASRILDPELLSALRQGLVALLARPWFRRAWILQEVANAQSALICCGQKSVSARLFPLMPVLLDITPPEFLQVVLDIMPGPSRKSTWWAHRRDMYHLLKYFASSRATEPRDIIYALRGISTDANDPGILTPNYKDTTYTILRQVCKFLFHYNLDGTASLDIREFVRRLPDLNNRAIGECIRMSRAKELSILLDRGNIHVSDDTVRCAFENTEKGLQLLRHVLQCEKSPLVLDAKAVCMLACKADADTMDMVFRQWRVVNTDVVQKFLLSAMLNEFHAPQVIRSAERHNVFIPRYYNLGREIIPEENMWLASLLNARTGFEAREEIMQIFSLRGWKNSAYQALQRLKNLPIAFSHITRHCYTSERELVPEDLMPFTEKTLISFTDQLQKRGWSADDCNKEIPHEWGQ